MLSWLCAGITATCLHQGSPPVPLTFLFICLVVVCFCFLEIGCHGIYMASLEPAMETRLPPTHSFLSPLLSSRIKVASARSSLHLIFRDEFLTASGARLFEWTVSPASPRNPRIAPPCHSQVLGLQACATMP